MKYALVNEELQEPQPRLSGKCKSCGDPVIAKCGAIKIWHWAHAGKKMCDPWWENETEWHRAWKGKFPKEWQEFLQRAENGEKHIADVKTDEGYVVEFQHSHIRPEERESRENFYKKMVWIVNGLRRSRDKNKFISVWGNSNSRHSKDLRKLYYFDECPLLRDWSDSKVPVLFDFDEDVLWGFQPKNTQNGIYLFTIRRDELIMYLRFCQETGWEKFLQQLNDRIKNKELFAEIAAAMREKNLQNHMRNRIFRRHKRM